MKPTLLIAFNGGAYGTYLEWAVNTLISRAAIESPFTQIGNSHNSKLGRHLKDLDGFRNYLGSGEELTTARLHPKTRPEESLKDNLEFLLDNTDRLILLYPDRSQELMCVCNYMTKIWQGDYYDGAMKYINPEDIFRGYDLKPDTDIRKIPTWMRREHMSFNLFDSWHAQVEWYFPDDWKNSRAMIITTRELFEDFESVLMRIENFWGRETYKRPISDLQPLHEEMKRLQTHLGKDQICEQILRVTLEGLNHLDFGELCLISQAWIQYQLRTKGYELRCHDLNDFPTDSDHLRSLIYKT